MLKPFTFMSVVVFLTLFGPPSYGQSATEIYIPIGGSPGLSGKATIIGSIDEVADRQITIGTASGTYKVAINKGTRIWLDKSRIKQPNETGSSADFTPGLKAEVKYAENDLSESVTAEWIKVEIAE